MQRSAEGKMRWVATLFPTEAFAQDAEMSLEAYEDFVGVRIGVLAGLFRGDGLNHPGFSGKSKP